MQSIDELKIRSVVFSPQPEFQQSGRNSTDAKEMADPEKLNSFDDVDDRSPGKLFPLGLVVVVVLFRFIPASISSNQQTLQSMLGRLFSFSSSFSFSSFLLKVYAAEKYFVFLGSGRSVDGSFELEVKRANFFEP